MRNRRVWPGRDEKVLTSWNGSRDQRTRRRWLARYVVPIWPTPPARAVDFIRQQCWRDGRLLATYKDGRARFAAYLDDYAFLLDGVIELMQTRWRSEDLTFATALAEALLAHFEDRESGGFFFTADDHEQLMHRSRSFSDEAVPAGNAIAAQALTRLGLLLGETRYLDAAAKTLRAAWPALQHYPHAHTGAAGSARGTSGAARDRHRARRDARKTESWRDELGESLCAETTGVRCRCGRCSGCRRPLQIRNLCRRPRPMCVAG